MILRVRFIKGCIITYLLYFKIIKETPKICIIHVKQNH